MEAYPARLEDKPVDFMADLGGEAAFQKLKNKNTGISVSQAKQIREKNGG